MNMNVFDENIFTHLAEHAATSTHDWARLSSAIVYKNRVISIGKNAKKTHPFQARFGRNAESIYMHAEISSIHKALRNLSTDEMKKSTLYVCRVKGTEKKRTFGLAKPCAGCMRAIVEFGIRKVVYTTDDPSSQFEIMH